MAVFHQGAWDGREALIRGHDSTSHEASLMAVSHEGLVR